MEVGWRGGIVKDYTPKEIEIIDFALKITMSLSSPKINK